MAERITHKIFDTQEKRSSPVVLLPELAKLVEEGEMTLATATRKMHLLPKNSKNYANITRQSLLGHDIKIDRVKEAENNFSMATRLLPEALFQLIQIKYKEDVLILWREFPKTKIFKQIISIKEVRNLFSKTFRSFSDSKIGYVNTMYVADNTDNQNLTVNFLLAWLQIEAKKVKDYDLLVHKKSFKATCYTHCEINFLVVSSGSNVWIYMGPRQHPN